MTQISHFEPRPDPQDLLARIERYWAELHLAKRLPARTSVDPARLDAALPYTMMLDRLTRGDAQVRVAGARLSAALGVDLRGLPVSLLFRPEARSRIARHFEDVFSGQYVIEVPLVASRGFFRRDLRARMLLLPLGDASGHPTRALAAIAWNQGPVPTDLRFAVDPRSAVRRTRIEDAGAEPAPLRPLPAPTPIERPAPSRRPALRLVVSNP